MSDNAFDLIVIGTGAGGGTLAWRLAGTGLRILLLERGDFLPREQRNWDAKAVFVQGRYQAKETWHDQHGNAFHPGIHYFVGGNTKVYGATLLRLRAEDFGELRHHGGVSPAWPVSYDTFEPYYAAAEDLYHVHGLRGVDPTEPPSSRGYAWPPVRQEPRIQELYDALVAQGHRPFPLPLGILLDEDEGGVKRSSPCVRCNAFDGYPCLVDAKADAQVICVEPALTHPNVTLLVNAHVDKLETSADGKRIERVLVTRNGVHESYGADVVVVACGAINSAALLLRSASERHPRGLANGSDAVGRHYMRHNNSAFMALSRRSNSTTFQKTFGLNDFYFGADDFAYPLGHIQMLGKSHGPAIAAEAPSWLPWKPDMVFDSIAAHAVDFWLTSEDLPDPDNRVTLDRDGEIVLSVTENNLEGHHRLKRKLEGLLGALDLHPTLLSRSLYLGKEIPIGGTAHQNGTVRFGHDPATSALDCDCKAHEVDNLYVVDGSFFPSCGAVNPTLTIIANALRVADRLVASRWSQSPVR